MKVEGHLSDQELKDVFKAFETMEKLADDLMQGKTGHVMESAEKVAGLESIASFEAMMQYERSASVQQATTSATSKSPEQEKLGSVVDEMMEAISKTIAKHINKFLDRLLDKFEEKDSIKASDLKLFREIQSDFLEKLLEEHESGDESHSEETTATESAEQAPNTGQSV